MAFEVGKRVVAESESTDHRPRSGVVEEVLRGIPRLATAFVGMTATRASTRPQAAPSEPNAREATTSGTAGRRRRGSRRGAKCVPWWRPNSFALNSTSGSQPRLCHNLRGLPPAVEPPCPPTPRTRRRGGLPRRRDNYRRDDFNRAWDARTHVCSNAPSIGSAISTRRSARDRSNR
jgi:hypothetical protein